ncbi:MAG: folate-binding protein [Coleofasciculaceae cyanobacterium]
MIEKLHDLQIAARATFEQAFEVMIPVSFANDLAAKQAASQGVALVDHSHWGVFSISDEDRLHYLHNQSTNDFQKLQPGQGCDTVFVTSTARTIDLATAYVTQESVLVLTSPHRRQKLGEWLDRYIFPMDRVILKDISKEMEIFRLIGPESEALLAKLGVEMSLSQANASHQEFSLGELQVRVAVGSGLALPGYTLLVDVGEAASLWEKLATAGAIPLGDRVWEQLRIEQGRPSPDYELTEDYNPLEAGLWQTISFDKGCYIGQETIARLNTYKGVKQQLWGVRLQKAAQLGATVMLGTEKVGKLTSCTQTEQGFFGLAYIRTKAGGKGLKVQIEDLEGEITDVPFLKTNPQ